ncbi:hypothetical protein FNF29_03425 [Cafeteria roenbergensis]|uniref:Uncharacterized protein n=2 Tax=Cafeteria roenbergensis TaxID=33653 RepID=A0A5A8CM36_CAFRO|nr:hypothetical protein FNF29_03425 [Cafeteria roenbergensis]|eukprot:KAA0152901.1 hypothetical protein FNF29_03425 [Cafeteria roenbergensis]
MSGRAVRDSRPSPRGRSPRSLRPEADAADRNARGGFGSGLAEILRQGRDEAEEALAAAAAADADAKRHRQSAMEATSTADMAEAERSLAGLTSAAERLEQAVVSLQNPTRSTEDLAQDCAAQLRGSLEATACDLIEAMREANGSADRDIAKIVQEVHRSFVAARQLRDALGDSDSPSPGSEPTSPALGTRLSMFRL